MSIERLMTAQEVAEVLRLGKSTVHAMSARGELPSVVVRRGRGRSVRRWRPSDVEAFIEEAVEMAR